MEPRQRTLRESGYEGRVNRPAKRQYRTRGPKRNGIHRRRNKKISW
jgi:hypothetical protein